MFSIKNTLDSYIPWKTSPDAVMVTAISHSIPLLEVFAPVPLQHLKPPTELLKNLSS